MVIIFIGLAALGLSWPLRSSPRRAQQPPTFKVEVNYVEIDASVTDAQGTFVPNLTKDDFQVLEDGQAADGHGRSRCVDIPVERSDPPLFKAAPIEPDVQRTCKEFNGRVFVIVLDDCRHGVHAAPRGSRPPRGSSSSATSAPTTSRPSSTPAAAANVARSSPAAARGCCGPSTSFMGNKLPRRRMTMTDDYYAQPRHAGTGRDATHDTNEMERGFKARNTLTALKNVADCLGGIRGRRKAVVFFSEGIDYDIDDPFNEHRGHRSCGSDMQDAIAAATRANVSIYGVDPRGLGARDGRSDRPRSVPNR